MQHTFMLILALSNNLLAYRQSVQQGDWHNSGLFSFFDHPVTCLAGKTLGIIGYGELGKAVATLGQAFDMNILVATSASGQQVPPRVELEELYCRSDVISLHCALTEKNTRMINAASLQQMKPSAILINTARGPLIDEAALADALVQHQIAGAGLDVLSDEPPHPGNPLMKLNLPNLIITPHIAWAGQSARQRLLNIVAGNISAFLNGSPQNIVC